MNKKPPKEAPANKSLLFLIEDVAKLLRSEAKKTESQFKKPLSTHSSKITSSDFVNGVELIAKLLSTQIQSLSAEKNSGSKPLKFFQISD